MAKEKVDSSAPITISTMFIKENKRTIRNRDTRRRKEMDVSRISEAFLSSPSPLVMEKRGAPPEETKPAKALIKEIRGKATPTPERARVPSPGICPINILSTMLYVTLTSSAKNMGAAILNICTGTLPFEKSPFLVSIAKYSDICENYTRPKGVCPLPFLHPFIYRSHSFGTERNKKADNISFFLILRRGDKTYLFLDPLFIEAVKNFEQFMIALLNAVFRESRIYY